MNKPVSKGVAVSDGKGKVEFGLTAALAAAAKIISMKEKEYLRCKCSLCAERAGWAPRHPVLSPLRDLGLCSESQSVRKLGLCSRKAGLKPEPCSILLMIIMLLITIISNAVCTAVKPRWPNKNQQHSRANCVSVTPQHLLITYHKKRQPSALTARGCVSPPGPCGGCVSFSI